jgi:outer membrane scaffolding protein for murein synthesis (MipA/OmpV family)
LTSKYVFRILIAIGISFNVFAKHDFIVNGGLGFAPATLGSKETKILPSLGFILNYENKLELSLGEVKAKLFSNEKFNFGLNLGIEEGRKRKQDEEMLEGIEDIPFMGAFGLFANYKIGNFVFEAKGKSLFSKRLKSFKSEISLGYVKLVNQKIILQNGFLFSFYESKLMDEFFGISEKESLESGLSAYSVRKFSLASIHFNSSVAYILNKKTFITLGGSYYIFSKDAKNSPLIKERGKSDGFSIALSLAYKIK